MHHRELSVHAQHALGVSLSSRPRRHRLRSAYRVAHDTVGVALTMALVVLVLLLWGVA